MLKKSKPFKFDPPIFCSEVACKGKRKILYNVTPRLAMGLRQFHYQCEACGKRVVYNVYLEPDNTILKGEAIHESDDV